MTLYGTPLLAKGADNACWQNDTRLTQETRTLLSYPSCFGKEIQLKPMTYMG